MVCSLAAASLAAQTPVKGSRPVSSSETDTVERVGKNGVSAPVVVSAPNPEFSEEARKDKRSGSVLIGLQIGKDGKVSHVHVIRGVGYGLDEKAVDAVQKYQFKPAMKDGYPVRVEINIEVNFQVRDRQPD